MYLSRLLLNLRSRLVRSELAQPYEMHRTLMRAFGDNLGKEERVLYRIETESRTDLPALLVQSQTRPAWDQLATGYLIERNDNPAIKPFQPRLAVGQLLAFRLVANPTKRLSERSITSEAAGSQPVDSKKVGKRVGLYTAEEQLDWLARKGNQHGFRLLTTTVGRQDQIKTTQPPESEGDQARLITLHGVQFDGILQVTNPDALTTTLATGIGSGKAFGFGLLSLAPAP